MLSRKELGFKRSLKALHCGDNLFPLTGSFPYKISKFTLADIFLVQELLKRRLHRWARLIRRQPGLEGLESSIKRWQKSARGGFLPLFHFFFYISYAKIHQQDEVRAELTRPHCSGAALHVYFFMATSTPGCRLAVFPGWGSQESYPVYKLSNGLQTHYHYREAVEACPLCHISTVSATSPQLHSRRMLRGVCVCVFCCACKSVCVCAKHSVKRKAAALKAWLIQFYTESHF